MWGIRLNGIEMMIDAGALTVNGGNGNGGNNDKSDGNGKDDGGVGIKASLQSSLDGMELPICFPYQGGGIRWMLVLFPRICVRVSIYLR